MSEDLLTLQRILKSFGIELCFNDGYKRYLSASKTYALYEGDIKWWLGEKAATQRQKQAVHLLHLLHQHCYEQRNALLDAKSVAVMDILRSKKVSEDKVVSGGSYDTILIKLKLYIPIA